MKKFALWSFLLGAFVIATGGVGITQIATTTIGALPPNATPSPSYYVVTDAGSNSCGQANCTWKTTLQQAVLAGLGISSLPINSFITTNGAGQATPLPMPLGIIYGGTATSSPNPAATSGVCISGSFPSTTYGLCAIAANSINANATGASATPIPLAVGSNTLVGNNGSGLSALTIAQAMMLVNGGPTKPTGALTLTTGTPVMTADVLNASSIFYTPFQGALVPIFDGTNWQMWPFTEQTLTLNASHIAAGSVYDVYDSIQAGVPTICSSPAWTSSTSRASTPIQLKNGINVNTNAMTGTCWNGTTAFTVASLSGTYLGSFSCTTGATSPACVTMQFKPSCASTGSNNILGLYNAYNRVNRKSLECDSTTSWTYALAAFRAQNASTLNRITFLDGLQQSSVFAAYQGFSNAGGGTENTAFAVCLDSTSTTTGAVAMTGTTSVSSQGFANINPQFGLHFVQACESAGGTNSATFFAVNGGNQASSLFATLEM